MDAYFSLFFVAFLAATLLPAYSEILFTVLVANGHDPLALWAWASAGNTLGAVVNWLLGRFLVRFEDRRWFPIRRNDVDRAQSWFRRYGVWTLLFAWAPIVGDALTFVAGLMRVPFPLFLVLTGIGKAGRYGVVLALALEVGLDG